MFIQLPCHRTLLFQNFYEELFLLQKEDGSIKGERYVRTLKHDKEGKIIKDHWELKGKAS